MAGQQQAAVETDQSAQIVEILGEIADRSRKLIEDFVARQGDLENLGNGHTPLGGTFM